MKIRSRPVFVVILMIFSFFCWAAVAPKYQDKFTTADGFSNRITSDPARVETRANTNYQNNRGQVINAGTERFSRNRNTIIEVQQQLYGQGILEESPSGVIDQSTSNAIRTFQKKKGLVPTGKLDGDTLNALGIDSQQGIYSE